jgi:hypothetical protein
MPALGDGSGMAAIGDMDAMTDVDTPRRLRADEAPLPDAGEPQGSRDAQRPAMLGRRFAQTIAVGMLIGLFVAIGAHALLVATFAGQAQPGQEP